MSCRSIGFFHDYMRRAGERRYLPEPERRREVHRKLAGYFAGHERDARTVDELPWQLGQGEDWEGLYELLTDLDFFQRAWEANQFEVKAYWVQVEAQGADQVYWLLSGWPPKGTTKVQRASKGATAGMRLFSSAMPTRPMPCVVRAGPR
jgi:hypothetical protein